MLKFPIKAIIGIAALYVVANYYDELFKLIIILKKSIIDNVPPVIIAGAVGAIVGSLIVARGNRQNIISTNMMQEKLKKIEIDHKNQITELENVMKIKIANFEKEKNQFEYMKFLMEECTSQVTYICSILNIKSLKNDDFIQIKRKLFNLYLVFQGQTAMGGAFISNATTEEKKKFIPMLNFILPGDEDIFVIELADIRLNLILIIEEIIKYCDNGLLGLATNLPSYTDIYSISPKINFKNAYIPVATRPLDDAFRWHYQRFYDFLSAKQKSLTNMMK